MACVGLVGGCRSGGLRIAVTAGDVTLGTAEKVNWLCDRVGCARHVSVGRRISGLRAAPMADWLSESSTEEEAELDALSRHAVVAALDSRAKDHLNRLASSEAKDAPLSDAHRKWQSIKNASAQLGAQCVPFADRQSRGRGSGSSCLAASLGDFGFSERLDHRSKGT